VINAIDEYETWRQAGETLVNAMRAELDKGSIGVEEFIRVLTPLWRRYQAGERTEQLLEQITALEQTKKSQGTDNGK